MWCLLTVPRFGQENTWRGQKTPEHCVYTPVVLGVFLRKEWFIALNYSYLGMRLSFWVEWDIIVVKKKPEGVEYSSSLGQTRFLAHTATPSTVIMCSSIAAHS
jgi:hypothetical protein